ncbi:MAG: ABC transporter permease [Sphaerochaetaceae bacterium]|jgi:simple sugar transport system permease protein|nr:ABC transporter permease [Sphaerochaetaceae bacterium]
MNKTLEKKKFSLPHSSEPYVFLVLLLLCILIEIRSGQFFTANNIVDICSAMIVPGLFAAGTFMVIISGGIDISFPALASLATYATTRLMLNMNYEGGVLIPILIALAIGAVLGAFNGLFIGYFDLPAMIVTLGSSNVFKGIMQGALKSKQLAVIPVGMRTYGTSALFTVQNSQSGLTSRMPVAFISLVLVYAVVYFVLHFTMFGRGIFAVGGNDISAHRAGIHVKRTKFLVYVFAGMIASLAGVTRTCMMQQCHPTNMLGMEMNIIAGVVLGGTAMAGGSGTLIGCVLGTLLIVTVENSMILLGISTTWKSVFVGAIILIGTAISAYQSTRKIRKKKIGEDAKAEGGAA